MAKCQNPRYNVTEGLMRRRGFTLIELLVVLAIVAILSALLFPIMVGAKASARKAASISNLKQLALATQNYLSDLDDTYPIYQVPVDGAYGYSWGTWWAVPSDWIGATDGGTRSIHENFVLNTLRRYIRNLDVFSEPAGMLVDPMQGAHGVGSPPPEVQTSTSYTYNGLLNGYQGSAVARPSHLIVFWNGSGRANFRGIGNVNPDLYCNDVSQPCVYKPKAAGCNMRVNGEGSGTWFVTERTGWDVHSGGLNYAYCDGHVRWRPVGVNRRGETNPRIDPNAEYEGQRALGQWYDEFYCHSYLFRPDFDFENWDPATRSRRY